MIDKNLQILNKTDLKATEVLTKLQFGRGNSFVVMTIVKIVNGVYLFMIASDPCWIAKSENREVSKVKLYSFTESGVIAKKCHTLFASAMVKYHWLIQASLCHQTY